MTVIVRNIADEDTETCASDAEACRWWLESGRVGDYLADTGEEIADVIAGILPGVRWHFRSDGCVVLDHDPEADTDDDIDDDEPRRRPYWW